MDATFPCELRLHQVKYIGVANDIIRRKYPTSYKAIPGIQLVVALIGGGVLLKIAQVEELVSHRMLSTYYIKGFFPLLTEIITNKLLCVSKRCEPKKTSDVR